MLDIHVSQKERVHCLLREGRACRRRAFEKCRICTMHARSIPWFHEREGVRGESARDGGVDGCMGQHNLDDPWGVPWMIDLVS